jgi:hypothetical protein
MTEPARLRARDAQDLTIISALVQDALVPLADVAYFQDQRRFVLALNRYRWDHVLEATRTHALLSFQSVDGVQSRKLDRTDVNRIHSVLTVTYTDGTVFIEFANGGSLRLAVGDLDCILEDVGEPWPAARQPGHTLP